MGNKTWSYCIMGNEMAVNCYSEFYELISYSLEDYDLLLDPRDLETEPLTDEKIRQIVEKFYMSFVYKAFELKSRLAFQILGIFFMEYGVKMPRFVKELILKYSRWKDERNQLELKKNRKIRRKLLFGFRENVLKYRDGFKIDVYYEPPLEGELSSSNSLQQIDYGINEFELGQEREKFFNTIREHGYSVALKHGSLG